MKKKNFDVLFNYVYISIKCCSIMYIKIIRKSNMFNIVIKILIQFQIGIYYFIIFIKIHT